MTDDATDSADRMSAFEAMMWELERSPMLSNAFANVTLLDRPPDRKRFRRRMEVAVTRVPRLRQRAVPAPARLAAPEWVFDDEFDLDHHLRWVDLGGGNRRDLFDLVAALSRHPFDRERPLWEFVVIEGMNDGRAAMLQRLHHTITDGEGGIRISVEFLDLERDQAPGDPRAESDNADDDDSEGDTSAGGDRSSDRPSLGEPAGPGEAAEESGLLSDAARALGDTFRHRSEQVISMLGSAGGIAKNPADAAELARSAARQMLMPPRCSPEWTDRSLQRWFGTSELDLAAVKAAAHALDGSVNDFFVTGATAGAASYHERAGSPVEQLRVSMPVSIRQGKDRDSGNRSVGGNAFAPTQTLLPTGEMAPAERFSLIHDALQATKSERALESIDSAAGVVNLLPSAALVAAGERLAGSVDFVCSNVKAAPFDLYIAGAFMEANYPIGPLAGTAFNLTTMSYRGYLFLGLVVDPVAVSDPDGLLKDIELAYDELFTAATTPR